MIGAAAGAAGGAAYASPIVRRGWCAARRVSGPSWNPTGRRSRSPILASPRATLDVYESDLPYLRVGAGAKLTFETPSRERSFEGKVASSSPS